MRTRLVLVALLAVTATAVPAHAAEEFSRVVLTIEGTVTMPCDGCGWRSDGTFTGTAATATRVESVVGTYVYDELSPCLTGAGHLTFVFAGTTKHVHWGRNAAVITGYADNAMVGAGAYVRDSSPCGGPATATVSFTMAWGVLDPGPPPA